LRKASALHSTSGGRCRFGGDVPSRKVARGPWPAQVIDAEGAARGARCRLPEPERAYTGYPFDRRGCCGRGLLACAAVVYSVFKERAALGAVE